MERITTEHCEIALRVVARQIGVPLFADYDGRAYADIPANALHIDSYHPDGWRGRIETKDGRTPFGVWRLSKRDLHGRLQAISYALDFARTVKTDGGTSNAED